MKLILIDGPMDGAEYVLSRLQDEPSTNRKPDGLWFDAFDDSGRTIKHEYAFDRLNERGTHVALAYKYVGDVVDLGHDFVTQEITK